LELDIQTELNKTAPYLNFLPLPKRIEEYEAWKEGVERVKANDVLLRARSGDEKALTILSRL
jgi:FAD dependent monooxygenase